MASAGINSLPSAFVCIIPNIMSRRVPWSAMEELAVGLAVWNIVGPAISSAAGGRSNPSLKGSVLIGPVAISVVPVVTPETRGVTLGGCDDFDSECAISLVRWSLDSGRRCCSIDVALRIDSGTDVSRGSADGPVAAVYCFGGESATVSQRETTSRD